MKILDQNDQEMQESEIDYDLGYLTSDRLFVEHHDAVDEVKEEGHYYPETVYFEDGTSYETVKKEDGNPTEDDPRITANDDGVSFNYVPAVGEAEREVRGMDVKYIIDVEHQDAKEAYDEYEDIQRWNPYTEEELAERAAQKEESEKQAEFLSTGSDRLTSTENDVADLSIMIADMIGV